MRKRICDYAEVVVRETGNTSVGYGDSRLLHMVAEKAGLPHSGWRTEVRILNALSKTPGNLVLRYFRARKGLGRVFYLRENAPKQEEDK